MQTTRHYDERHSGDMSGERYIQCNILIQDPRARPDIQEERDIHAIQVQRAPRPISLFI